MTDDHFRGRSARRLRVWFGSPSRLPWGWGRRGAGGGGLGGGGRLGRVRWPIRLGVPTKPNRCHKLAGLLRLVAEQQGQRRPLAAGLKKNLLCTRRGSAVRGGGWGAGSFSRPCSKFGFFDLDLGAMIEGGRRVLEQ